MPFFAIYLCLGFLCDKCGAAWDCAGLCGIERDCVGLSGTVRDCVGLSGTAWDARHCV